MRRRTEDGSALVELTWLAILLLIPVIWIVISARYAPSTMKSPCAMFTSRITPKIRLSPAANSA